MENIGTSNKRFYQAPAFENIRQMIDMSLERHNDHVAYILKDKVEFEDTYNEIRCSKLKEDFQAFGTYLLKQGLYNKFLGIYSENRYEWNVAYLSIICGLGIVTPIDKSLPEDEVAKLLQRETIDLIVTSAKNFKNVLGLKKSGAYKGKIVLMDLYNSPKDVEKVKEIKEQNPDVISMKEAIEEGKKILKDDKEYENLPIDNEAMAALLFTSATTSTSKAVMLSHRNIAANIMDIVSIFDITVGDRLLSLLPLHHSFECTVGFLSVVYSGGTICYTQGIKYIASELKEYAITAMIAVPALFEVIHNKILHNVKKAGRQRTFDLAIAVSNTMRKFGFDKRREIFSDVHKQLGGRLRLLVSGAAALSPKVQKGMDDIGISIYQGYGLTETSPVIAATCKEANRVGSVGRPFPSVTVKIDSKDNQTLGEILVKGPNVMIGYYKDPENNKAVFDEDGWLRTGDLGYFDESSYLYIAGRTKNVIVLKNGKNVFPDESEALIANIESVKEAMVFGHSEDPNDPTDVMLKAKIVYDPDYYQGKDMDYIYNDIWEQVKEVNRVQPTYKYIKKIYLTTEPLIKTTTLKVKRYEEMKKIQKEFLEPEQNKNKEEKQG